MSLTLIRHAAPQRDTTMPSRDWRLSHAGRQSCTGLAEQLRPLGLSRLIASVEPKAVETARLTAAQLAIPSEIAFGLHEHDRSNMGFFPDGERFAGMVADLFARPDELVFGRETATQAQERFAASLAELRAAHPGEALGVVAHGTVITLLVAAHNAIEPLAFWQALQMPDVIRVDDDYGLLAD